ncbi:MAG: serine/threonine-protein kinase [Pseudomonadota bacterium]
MQDLEKLQTLFNQAVELESDALAAFLDQACGDDTALRQQLENLLEADRQQTQGSDFSLADEAARVADSMAGSDPDADLEGKVLGAYRLLERIGAGGMGTVFLAERADGAFQRQVAVKVVRRGMDSEQVLQRFQAEREILSRLDHPNIAALLDGGMTPDGRPYLVMEYVDGVPLTEYCDGNRLSISRRLSLFQAVCRAVHHAHRNLVVHRDLKPSNILVDEAGTVKLLDFGIAKLLDDSEDVQLTRTGMRALTPAYASPEQLAGEPVTTGTDVYALGVILYELLAGRRPFEALRTPEEMRQQVLSGDAPKPSTAITKMPADSDGQHSAKTLETISASRSVPPGRLRQALEGDLDTICLMAIRREPAERYGSAEQLAEDVDRHLAGQPVQAQAPSLGYRFGKFVRRHRVGVATTAAVVLAFAALITFYTQQLQEERDTALEQQARAEAVTEFLTGLFSEADPFFSLGEDVTARQILETGRDNLAELDDQPELQATMEQVLGRVYYAVGNSPQAEELLTEAATHFEPVGGLDAAEISLVLGFIQQDRGDYAAARASFDYTFDERVKVLGPEHELVREAIGAQAFLEETEANFAEAAVLHERAFAMAKALFPGDDLVVAQAHSDLGGFYWTQDRREEAESVLGEGIAMMERLYPEGHPLTGELMRQMGELLRDMARYEEAEPYLLGAIEMQEKMLGKRVHEVAVSWNALSTLYSATGRTEEAIDANQYMIGILEELFDGATPALGPAYNNLAFMLMDQERYDEAIENFDRSLGILDALDVPPDHFNRTFPSSGKAEVLMIQDRLDEAEPLWRNALEVRLAVVGEEHRLTNETRSDLAALLIERGTFDEAEALLFPAHAFFTANDLPESLNRREANERMAEFYERQGLVDKAAPYWEALEAAEAAMETSDA